MCSKLKNNFFLENEYAGTAQETEKLNPSTMIMILIVASQKINCMAQFKVSFSCAEKTAHV